MQYKVVDRWDNFLLALEIKKYILYLTYGCVVISHLLGSGVILNDIGW